MSVILAPSILSADFDHIEEEIALAVSSGAQFLHIDVMDGHFVPAYTFDENFVAKVTKGHPLINDVHLMIVKPETKVEAYAEAGADIITFHYEAMESDEACLELVRKIHSLGKKAGISIKPMTGPEALFPFWEEIDLALVMSVEPGKGGQKFMPEALGKIQVLHKKNQESENQVLLEVDGGINQETGRQCVEAGVEALVAGSYLFGHEDFKKRAEGLLQL